MKRKRAYIPFQQRHAAALACLLPQELRDLYRKKKVTAAVVISQFEVDHITLHAWGGSDEWWNLDLLLKPAHREKSRADTARVAKSKRLDEKWRPFTRAMAKGRKPPRRRSRWSKRRFPK